MALHKNPWPRGLEIYLFVDLSLVIITLYTCTQFVLSMPMSTEEDFWINNPFLLNDLYVHALAQLLPQGSWN